MGDMISGVRMPGGWEQNVEYKAQAAAGLGREEEQPWESGEVHVGR